uniref:Uncharacterized protein n=1 Tax=Ditylenchus dipsaci TaxID=166011 RepID=A0A915EAC2_9BILA
MDSTSLTRNRANGGWRLTIEPVMFIYMCSTFIKFPYSSHCSMRRLVSTKFTKCADLSAVHDDVDLQKEANHLLMTSSLCLLLPSIFIALILGSLCDVWSIKKTLLIPFVGLLIADFNYIFQCFSWIQMSTACCSVILFSVFLVVYRCHRHFICLQCKGQSNISNSSASLGLHYNHCDACFTHHLKRVENEPPALCASLSPEGSLKLQMPILVTTGCTDTKILNMVMVALAIEIVAFAGLMDILFSYMRFQLKWTDKEYGWFNGAGTGLSSVTVIFLYPILHRKFGFSNAVLATLGLLTKISNLLVLAFVTTSWVAMVSVVLLVFGRFISTGLRSLASFYVKNNEQGKIFSFISFMEGCHSWCIFYF